MFRVALSCRRVFSASVGAAATAGWMASQSLRCDEEQQQRGLSSLLTCPGNFDDLEDKRSIDVQASSGISAGFVKLLHKHSPPTSEEAATRPLSDPAILQVVVLSL